MFHVASHSKENSTSAHQYQKKGLHRRGHQLPSLYCLYCSIFVHVCAACVWCVCVRACVRACVLGMRATSLLPTPCTLAVTGPQDKRGSRKNNNITKTPNGDSGRCVFTVVGSLQSFFIVPSCCYSCVPPKSIWGNTEAVLLGSNGRVACV